MPVVRATPLSSRCRRAEILKIDSNPHPSSILPEPASSKGKGKRVSTMEQPGTDDTANDAAVQTNNNCRKQKWGNILESSTNRPSNEPLPKVKRAKKTLAEKDQISSLETPLTNTTTGEWPQHFKSLEKTHRSLNIVYTFCCTRKHLATTFENIKSAVEGHIKRELAIEEIAQIKYLVPKSVFFGWVEGEMVRVDVGSSFPGRKRTLTDLCEGSLEEETLKPVLLFEFIDGDLKRKTNRKTGDSEKGPPVIRRQRDESLKMPVYSQAQMVTLINKRNKKFESAVNEFLNTCTELGEDPVEKIKAGYQTHIPVSPFQSPENSGDSSGGAFSTIPKEIPKQRKPITEIIEEIKNTPDIYHNQIVPDGHKIFPAQDAVYGDLEFSLSQNLMNALYNTRNITRLYSHQAEAINYLHNGHNVIVSTSTSSGKSLIYQIPVLHELEQDRDTRAIYIFPTKALAQDQRRGLKELLGYMGDGLCDLVTETFDGDTKMEDRNMIREMARIVFTNPDMLHLTILPNEEKWRTFLKNLKFIVVDELHVYNGLFGSHMAFIMRRLRRICSALGNNRIRFISCSATVANPEEHMKTIFGLSEVKLIEKDGSPAGQKQFLAWNCPFKDLKDPKCGRVDPISEASMLFVQLILRGVRVIAFCRVRKVCEVTLTAVKAELTRLERTDVIPKVMAYRGGYTPQDRRQIEHEMFKGGLLGIVATNALELGVDIGTLDAVLTISFPYTISNFRQQAGRAGRRNKDSLSVLIGDAFPTDQHYMSNPHELFTKPNVALQVDLSNLLILEAHLQCAAFEMPIRLKEDAKYFGIELESLCQERLIPSPDPSGDGSFYYHCHPRFRPSPAKFVPIRDTEDGSFSVIDITQNRNAILENLELSRATFTIYEGGIFLHQGRSYLVREFLPDKNLAKVELVNVDWITQQRDFTNVDPTETEIIRTIPGSSCRAFYGKIRIESVVFGFFKVDRKSKQILDAVEVDNPPITRMSKGLWLDIPTEALIILRDRRVNLAASIHAAEHAVLELFPNWVVSLPGDVRTECKSAEKEYAPRATLRKRPARLTFYDSKTSGSVSPCGVAAGKNVYGSGISWKAFEFIDLLLKQAVERIEACPCGSVGGCPECVASTQCKEGNEVLSKVGARVILRSLLGWEVAVGELPMGPEVEEGTVVGRGGRRDRLIETVVPAVEVRGVEGKEVQVLVINRKA